jgi:gamma-glutamyltranspeptidase/glutathione hydrolase
MGGASKAHGHGQVLLNLLVFRMDLQEAIDTPRFRHFGGLRIGLETPMPEVTRAGLAELGHQIVALPPGDAGELFTSRPRGT